MRRPVFPAALSAVALLLLSGCSTPERHRSTPDESPAPSTATHGSYAECLRANGVPPSAGPISVAGPPAGVSPATWEQAVRACSALAPGPPGP